MQDTSFDASLIRRYAGRIPRYTSYPTAPHFRPDVEPARLAALLRQADDPERALSLYLHIPFCRSLCWYCGCAKVISRSEDARRIYIARLIRELEAKAALFDGRREVVQVHFGGGTPSDLPPDLLREVLSAIRRLFRLAPHAETAIEIDPRDLTREQVRAMAEGGLRRASLGVQDTRPEVQEAVNRVQPFALVQQSVEWLREEGFESINVDLIYGLPRQSPASIRETLAEVLTLQPDRFAVYGYAHVPQMRPSQKIVERAGLPDAEARLQMQATIVETLTAAGYVHVGMDHYARPDDELAVALREGSLQRNFQGYSTRGGTDIVGFGMSAISSIGPLYVAAPRELPDWEAAVDAGVFPAERWYVLSEDDRIRRHVIETIMCAGALDLDEVGDRFGLDAHAYFAAEWEGLAALEADGLVTREGAELRITPRGRYLVRNVAARFDAWLDAVPARYSQAI